MLKRAAENAKQALMIEKAAYQGVGAKRCALNRHDSIIGHKLNSSLQPQPKEPTIYTQPQLSSTARATLRADELFSRSYRIGQLKMLWALFTRQSRELPMLDAIDTAQIVRRYSSEAQAIRLQNIRGSEGKIDEFDVDFYPLHRRSKQRWISVATGMLKDPAQFTPIDVVQVGASYYVTNGHHRVSVALRLGYIFIDANITVWELAD